MKKSEVRLYNVLFPIWMLVLFPQTWLTVLPGNFAIDSLVLLLGMMLFGVSEKKPFYKRHILKIYLFGLLADFIGSAYMLLMMVGFDVGSMGDEWYLTVPGIAIAAVMIFVFNYFFTFKKEEKPLRVRLALLFAVVTAPYTFLIPTSVLYG